MINDIEGSGLFFRDKGLEPPSFRKLLREVGLEDIKELTIWREPIALNKLKKLLGIKTYYDDLFHLSLNINEKYNLDKQAVLTFTRGEPKGEILKIQSPNNLTIQQLVDNTKKFMGKEKYTSYSSKNNNCQDFLLAVLQSNNLLTEDAKNFIKQDTNEIFKNLPKYSEFLSDTLTNTQAFINRQIQGEGIKNGPNLTGLIDIREPYVKF